MSMGWLDNLKRGMKKTANVLKLTKVDFDSLEDDSVTIRDRDTTEQVRVKIAEL